MCNLRKTPNFIRFTAVIFIFTAQLFVTTLALSDKRLCADENCKETISLGAGKVTYPAGAEGMVSFKINAPIRVKSKSAGKDPSLWGIEVNGREGYAPKQLILEKKILISEKNLKYIVDVKPTNAAHLLKTSENPVETEIPAETTTKPLNVVPLESTEKPLKSDTTEDLTLSIPAAATSMLSEVSDSTEIPNFTNVIPAETTTKPLNAVPLKSTEKLLGNDTTEDLTLAIPAVDTSVLSEVSDSTEIPNFTNVIPAETTTKPLNVVPLESTEKPLGNYTTKDLNLSIPAAATSVLLEVVDGTEIPNFTNESDGVVDNVEEENELIGQHKVEGESDYDDEIENYDEEKEDEISYNQKSEKSVSILKSSSHEVKDPNSDKVDYSTIKEETFTGLLQYPSGSKGPQKEINPIDLIKNQAENLVNLEQPEENIFVQNDSKISDVKANKNSETQTKNSAEELQRNNDYIKEPHNVEEKLKNSEERDKNSVETGNKTNNYVLSLKSSQENSIQIDINNPVIVGNTDQQAEIKQLGEKTEGNSPNSFMSNNIIDMITSTELQSENNQENNNLPQEHADIKSMNIVNSQAETVAEYNEIPQEQSELNSIEGMETNKVVTPTYNEYLSIEPSDIEVDLSTETIYNQREIQTASSSSEDPVEQLQNNNEDGLQINQGISPTYSEPSDIKADSSTEISKTKEFTNEGNQYSNLARVEEKSSNQEQHTTQTFNPTSYTTDIPPNDYFHTQQYDESSYKVVEELFDTPTTTIGYNSIQSTTTKAEPAKSEEKPAETLPSSLPHLDDNKEKKGLFATIMGTVNNVLSINKKIKRNEHDGNSELDRILFSNSDGHTISAVNEEYSQYCKHVDPNGDCPQSEHNHQHQLHSENAKQSCTESIFNSDLTLDTFIKLLASKILEISELLAFLIIVAVASLLFIFGYYCFCNSSREGSLLFKLNQLESSLLAQHKENMILKHNLMSTKQKLTSIEDNSFGSNDMVVSLKKELEGELMEKARLQEQITVLQKELENAADAGIELNKMVLELLSNQTGDESIISSVEELQKQLNEQQNTILAINASLAEKSRENSELQLLIAEQNVRYEAQLSNLQRDNDELEHERNNLLTKLDELKTDFDKDITVALEGKNMEIKRLQNEIVDLNNKVEKEHTKWQTSAAKIEALEECLKNIRRDPNVNITEVIDVANVKAQLIEVQKKYTTLKERFDLELDQRKFSETQLEMLSGEVERLKHDFNQSEKDKLEAQTRLEVLSNYFKDKENQLQKELSLKEAMWLKQQGETTTTVDRVTTMQEEIQSLKSQNDSLRAEIEAQLAAHKAQTGTLENRAHETWLAARQSDRRYEEARAEATALRRQLTALAGGNVNEANKPPAVPSGLGDELTQAPSPIQMESPGSPMLGRIPPPPFLPPPFMGPPPPFMGMPPPPPFVPPGEMRPAPLGRIMSPPPQRSGRFSPQHLDYEDYLDYDGNNTWHRHTYSPPPRTYRSLSPTDSRYNYGTERDLMSTYDTETDFSPPPSPRESRRRGGHINERIDDDGKSPFGNTKRKKGPLSSGSEKSFSSPHHDTKTKKGKASNGGGGGKNLV